ncbi:MAG: thiamine phosphate synthase [Candidatus Protistobacter heckmanni]|nr:thiamine phosphate synthase [Candidatus Protistobacter heckmanni]
MTLSTHAFPSCPASLGVYAVVPTADWVRRTADAGIEMVQLRYKMQDGDRAKLEAQVREAVAAGAYGVHLGQEDLDALSPADLDALRASGLRLGASTHSDAELQRALALKPRYVAIGAVFHTTTKPMKSAPQGLDELARYVRMAAGFPTIAIGCVNLENMREVLKTGASSVAVVRAITEAADPAAAIAALQNEFAAARI